MRYLIIVAAALAFQACGTVSKQTYPSGIRYDLSCPCLPKRGSVLSGLTYDPAYLWSARSVNVCFDNGTQEQQAWVRDAVQKTWGLASKLEVTWNRCESDIHEVHIRFSDHLAIDNIGVQLNKVSPGLTLGTFRNDERDLRMQAVYGFGFVMGFTSGQDRGDSTCGRAQRFSAYSVRTLGPPDPNSAMNECKAPVYNGGILSDGDIAGAQRVYGEPETCECP